MIIIDSPKETNTMIYTTKIDTDTMILSVIVSGVLTVKEVASLDKKIRLKAKELNCKIIFDFRETKNCISMPDAYFLFHPDCCDLHFSLRDIPVVKILNDYDETFFRFLELTSNNKGCRIKICKNETSAFQWLAKF